MSATTAHTRHTRGTCDTCDTDRHAVADAANTCGAFERTTTPAIPLGYPHHSYRYYLGRAYVMCDRERVCIDPVSPELAHLIACERLGVADVTFLGFNSLGHLVYARVGY